ncbi:unnamed protein product, partial [Rotaria socialis]
MNDSFTENVG